jgi:hypothetical protein
MWLQGQCQHHLPTIHKCPPVPPCLQCCTLLADTLSGQIHTQDAGCHTSATGNHAKICASLREVTGLSRPWRSSLLVFRAQPCGSNSLGGVDGSVRGQSRRRGSPHHDSTDEEAEKYEFVVRYRRDHSHVGIFAAVFWICWIPPESWKALTIAQQPQQGQRQSCRWDA